MAREFMPKSSALMPYIVVNRDAAVAGVFTVDGEGGSVDLTGKYVQITDYNQRVGSLEAQVTTNTGDITNLKTAVTSINGSITSINTSLNNKAAKGANSDITSLTALSGPLRLGGDAVNAYDAVTLRQLQASSGGSGGATLNGVMNNNLGAVEWFNGSRAKLWPGRLASDGQLLNRADYPDLWNAISSGVLVSVSDSVWTGDALQRAAYSTGDGSTTFRLPDLNGVQTNSIKAPFLRGDSGLTVGNMQQHALAAHTHTIASRWWVSGGTTDSANLSYASNSATGGGNFTSSSTGGTETRPNSAIGIWVIRVSGTFTAASTNFNVITGDTTSPANGTIVSGGDIKSVYQVGGVDTASAVLRAKYTIGGAKSAEVGVVGGTGSLKISSSGEVLGVTNASDASVGEIGEYKEGTNSGVGMSNSTFINVATLSLTAGDWDVDGIIQFNPNGTTVSSAAVAINTISATGPGFPYTVQMPVTNGTLRIPSFTRRISISSTTTVYLIGLLSVTGSGATADGFIRARRVR